ncbi:MAG: hypothetical protein JWN78_153 [Bacteroidota bacterium]|nr:hypothetical protein [Bacteroidota bacterium]
MKRILKTGSLLLFACIMICVSSCKKKSSTTPAVTYLLKSFIHEKAGVKDTTVYSFNNDGKVIAAVMGTSNVIYTYSGHTINRTRTQPPFTPSRDSIIIGSNGYISEDYLFHDDGTISTKNIYSYNSQNQLSQLTSTEYPSMVVTITTVTMSNGDLVGETYGSNTATIDYYDKPAATGDYWYVAQFTNYGSFYYKPNHLVKTIINGGSTNSFAYEFDSNGNVSKLTITEGANIDVYNMTWLAN